MMNWTMGGRVESLRAARSGLPVAWKVTGLVGGITRGI